MGKILVREDRAYIAMRSGGFVNGACFAHSSDTEDWISEMKGLGFKIEVHERAEAKKILFTNVKRSGDRLINIGSIVGENNNCEQQKTKKKLQP